MKNIDKTDIPNKIEEEVSRTLNMLDRQLFPEHNPFFYTRVMERINRKTNENYIIFKIKFLFPAILAILFILNIFTVLSLSGSSEIPKGREENLRSFANEYSISRDNNSYYNTK
jgi:hypothetical protein